MGAIQLSVSRLGVEGKAAEGQPQSKTFGVLRRMRKARQRRGLRLSFCRFALGRTSDSFNRTRFALTISLETSILLQMKKWIAEYLDRQKDVQKSIPLDAVA